MLADPPLADALLRGALLSVLALLWVVVLARIVGLRSFSKMTTFDFVMTVAMGSLVAGASQATQWTQFGQALAAMAGLFAVQWAIARGRHLSDGFGDLVQNTPVILMRDGEICDAALSATRVARADLIAKLRQAGVAEMADVSLVVLETTGDISVLTGAAPEARLLDNTRVVGTS
ncbi:MAG: DUF421 domain-containing protein [Roseicyclus sp.]